jgi:hypothetical protein
MTEDESPVQKALSPLLLISCLSLYVRNITKPKAYKSIRDDVTKTGAETEVWNRRKRNGAISWTAPCELLPVARLHVLRRLLSESQREKRCPHLSSVGRLPPPKLPTPTVSGQVCRYIGLTTLSGLPMNPGWIPGKGDTDTRPVLEPTLAASYPAGKSAEA